MRIVCRALLFVVLWYFASPSAPLATAQETSDPVSQALAQGDLYQSKRKYELALDAYHKADKLAHHESAPCYLKIASVERKLGDFSSALDNAKKAIKVAGDDNVVAIRAHQVRASLLAQAAGKPTDKKLKEAEEELRQALALDPKNELSHFDLGVILLRQERDSDGLAELNTYISFPGADARTAGEARRMIANPIRARAPFAPDFSFVTHENQSVSNSSLRGKVVLLDFWGTWCPPCRESVPVLRNLKKKYDGKAFQLVGISSDDDEEVWRTFIGAQHMDWWEYIDLEGKVLQDFKIESFPTYIVLDKDGVIRFRQSGFGELTQGELEDAINKALKRTSDPKLAAALAEDAASSAGAQTPVGAAPRIASAVPGHSEATKAASGSDSSNPSPPPSGVAPDAEAGIEGGSISGNVYKNTALGLTFQFPPNWKAATPESLRAINDRMGSVAKAAILQQHPEMAGAIRFNAPKVVFYGSRRGEWDGQRLEIPSIRISAVPSRLDSVDIDAFQNLAEKMASASGMKLTGPLSEFRVNKHPFARADFERSVGATRMYQSYVQTVAGDYLLSIEIFAYSLEELQHVAASLQSIVITEDEH